MLTHTLEHHQFSIRALGLFSDIFELSFEVRNFVIAYIYAIVASHTHYAGSGFFYQEDSHDICERLSGCNEERCPPKIVLLVWPCFKA